MTNGKSYVCSICGGKFSGFGNNPWPVTKGAEDRCCDGCNATKVIPARIYALTHKVDDDAEVESK